MPARSGRCAAPSAGFRGRTGLRAGLRLGSCFPLLGRLGGRRWSTFSLGLAAPLPCGRAAPDALLALTLPHLVVALSLATGLRRSRSLLGRGQLHPGATRLGEANGHRLLLRAHAVLALPYVLHLLADELPCLSARCLALMLCPTRALDRFLFWHVGLPTFPRGRCKTAASTAGQPEQPFCRSDLVPALALTRMRHFFTPSGERPHGPRGDAARSTNVTLKRRFS